MDNENTPIKAQENKNENGERAADIITAQPVVVKCGEREYTLTPRTPHQLRAISKYLTEYNKGMAASLLGLLKGETEESKIEDRINNDAIDSMIVLIQMLLDENKTFNFRKPTISKKEIEHEVDFGQIVNVIHAAAEMHDVRDLISQMQRLRVI